MFKTGIGSITFTGARFFVSLVGLTLLKIFRQRVTEIAQDDLKISDQPRVMEKAVLCGSLNALASIFQQYSMISISSSQCAFITSAYVVIVPFFEWMLPWIGGMYLETVYFEK